MTWIPSGSWLTRQIPSEITAICVLFQFWTDLNPAVFIVIFIALTALVGFLRISWLGEVEFAFVSQ